MEQETSADNKADARCVWAECGRCADAFYRAMTAITIPSKIDEAESVYVLAVRFDESLDRFLECLTLLPPAADVKEYRDRGMLYKSVLAPDLAYLRRASKSKRPRRKRSKDATVNA